MNKILLSLEKLDSKKIFIDISKDLNYELALEESFVEDYILEVSTA